VSDLGGTLGTIGALVTAASAIVAAVISYRNSRKVDGAQKEILVTRGEVVEVGKRIDGRLSELLATTEKLARAQGVAEGRAAQKAENDAAKKP